MPDRYPVQRLVASIENEDVGHGPAPSGELVVLGSSSRTSWCCCVFSLFLALGVPGPGTTRAAREKTSRGGSRHWSGRTGSAAYGASYGLAAVPEVLRGSGVGR